MQKKLLFISLILLGGGILFLYYELYNTRSKMLMSPTQKPKNTVELVIGGDIMLSRGIGRWAKNQGYDRIFTGENFHPLHQFSCFKKGECLLVFNLESPFSEKDNDQPQ